MPKFEVIYSVKRVKGEIWADNIGLAVQRARKMCGFYNSHVTPEHKKNGWTMEIVTIIPEQGKKITI